LSVIVTGASLLAVGHLLRVMGADARASRRLLRFTGLVLINVGLLGICIMTSLLMATITWLVAHFVWIRAAIQYRAAQKRNLFAALALAVKNHMPLAPMALAFANEQEGGFARRAYALASELEEGASLSDAVLHARGALPREAALAARVGAESGDLGEALAATTHNSAFDYTLLRPAAVRMVYVVPAFLFFLTFMKIKIEPSMIKIFADFDTPLPMFSAMMMGQMGRYSPTAEVLILLMFLSFMLAVVIWLQCIGVLTPRLPGLKRIINWIDAGPLLRVLALAAETGRPLSTMLVVVGRLHPKRSLRRRVRAAVREMDDGRPWQESLQRGRLIGLADAALLAAAQRNGNLPWALGEMAESFERRANYRLQALTQVALPLLMLPMGLIVAAFMVAYFAPLTALIWSLSF
jgi:type II secretory pathway component PulF